MTRRTAARVSDSASGASRISPPTGAGPSGSDVRRGSRRFADEPEPRGLKLLGQSADRGIGGDVGDESEMDADVAGPGERHEEADVGGTHLFGQIDDDMAPVPTVTDRGHDGVDEVDVVEPAAGEPLPHR